MLPEYWFFWGLGWLFMPRMTIGIMIGVVTQHSTLALVLTIIGAIIDVIVKINQD